MVTATNGILRFRGQSGQEYVYNAYISDVVAATVKFSTSAAASATVGDGFIITPEPVELIDVAIVTGPTVIFNFLPYVNDILQPSMINLAAVINTLQTRSFTHLKLMGGRKFALIQA
jgi:hypothetical protein